MKKIAVGIVSLALGICSAMAVTSTTITNHGVVLQTHTASQEATDTQNISNTVSDCSTYAGVQARHGTIVRRFSVAKYGPTAGKISLENPKSASQIPDNAVILGGFIDVLVAVEPQNGITNSLGINTAADIFAAASNTWQTTGIKAIIPVGTAATAVKATNNMPFTFTHIGSITQGVFEVYLDYYQSSD